MKYNRKGQTISEMALFGTLILFAFGTMLSYVQRQNDQQYAQMEAFRRALQRGCSYIGEKSKGAGASVQYTLIENRRHADPSGGFKKGNSQTISASSNVYWAVPEVSKNSTPDSLIVFKVNEDEHQANYRDFVPKDKSEKWVFRTEDISYDSSTGFNETATKQEDTKGISNTRASTLKEDITTNIPYTVRKDDKDYNDENDEIIEKGTFWKVKQGLYRDTDGQYKYSAAEADNAGVTRSRTWQTEFAK